MNIKSVIEYKQIRTARYDKAMLHSVRMYVLELLSNHICCYSGDLSEELMIAKLTLSQHLIELKEAGLIKGEIESPRIKNCIDKENRKEDKQLFKQFLGVKNFENKVRGFTNYEWRNIDNMNINKLKL